MRRSAAILAILLCSCDIYVASDHYSNMHEARSAKLFEKGWLPDFLPNSSVNIRTNNNVSDNNSTGSFEFDARDASRFYDNLNRGAPDSDYFKNWDRLTRKFNDEGFSAWTYREDGFTWVFFCASTNNRCEYFLWPTQYGG